MIEIINDNFNDLAKDYYKLQEEYEQLEQENKKLQIQLDNYNLLINDILNKINEFKAKTILEILGDKNGQ